MITNSLSRRVFVLFFALSAPLTALGGASDAKMAAGHGHEHQHQHDKHPGHDRHSHQGMHKEAKHGDVDTSRVRQTKNFRIAYTSEVTPIPVNAMHSWKLKITTRHGNPVKGATVTVDGDMPAHGHGLPTQPEVTREIGEGVYLVEGMKFSMPGHWVMEFDIAANGKRDTAAFDLVLK